MTLLMGTLHAYSVFTADLEQTLFLSRAQVSLVYSVALVALTLAVLFAVPLFARWAAPVLFATACGLAGLGLLVAGSGSAHTLFLGYGIVFGLANGLGYGYALQLSARVSPGRSGLAMGITTAAYAMGSVVGANVLGAMVDNHGAVATLRFHGLSFLFAAPMLATLLVIARTRYRLPNEPDGRAITPDRSRILRYWWSYGLGCAAGLMAIAHAAPYVTSIPGGTRKLAVGGVIMLGLGNTLGGVVAGYLSDRISVHRIIVALPSIAAAALALAALSTHAATGIAALCVIGLSYGALIAVYPVAIARDFGSTASAGAYGRVFTAWGTAGLLAPFMAGHLYDVTISYRIPMLTAMVLSLASAATALYLKRP
jgi:MFS family permease